MGHNFFRHGVAAFVALAIFCQSDGRDLRPSDHGLAYQEDSSPPAQNGDEQEMLSFFGTTTPPQSVQLPEAKNISDTWWSGGAGGRTRDVGKDHVRVGLLAASAVCGLTGVVLLVVSGVVFLYRLRKEKRGAERMASTSAPAYVAHAANEK